MCTDHLIESFHFDSSLMHNDIKVIKSTILWLFENGVFYVNKYIYINLYVYAHTHMGGWVHCIGAKPIVAKSINNQPRTMQSWRVQMEKKLNLIRK